MFRLHSRLLYQYSTILTIMVIAKKALTFDEGYRNISFFLIRCFLLIINLLGVFLAMSTHSPIGILIQIIAVIFVLGMNRSSKLNLIKLVLVTCLSLFITSIT